MKAELLSFLDPEATDRKAKAARVLLIPNAYLGPNAIALRIVGAYAASYDIYGVWVMFGLVGDRRRRYGNNRYCIQGFTKSSFSKRLAILGKRLSK